MKYFVLFLTVFFAVTSPAEARGRHHGYSVEEVQAAISAMGMRQAESAVADARAFCQALGTDLDPEAVEIDFGSEVESTFIEGRASKHPVGRWIVRTVGNPAPARAENKQWRNVRIDRNPCLPKKK